MIAPNAHADPQSTLRTDHGPWRMDPPPPTGPQDLLLSAWPGALVALLLLGLLLAFGSVVRDGVRRGEQLRSQAASADWRCDALGPQAAPLSCTRPAPSARLRSADSSQALSQASVPPLPTRPTRQP